MTISKLYLVVCAAALCAGVIAVRANDNPEQAAARAALEAKMRELNTAPITNNTPPPAPAEPAEQTTSTAPAASATPSGTNSQQSMNQPESTTSTPAQTTEQTEHASTTSSPNHGWFQTVPPPSGARPMASESPTTAGHETSEPKTSTGPQEEHPRPTTTVQAPAQAPAQPVYTERQQNPNTTYPGKRLGLNPIQAPPLPINQTQQEQLRALLQRYEANAITPEQYQTERARILNGR